MPFESLVLTCTLMQFSLKHRAPEFADPAPQPYNDTANL